MRYVLDEMRDNGCSAYIRVTLVFLDKAKVQGIPDNLGRITERYHLVVYETNKLEDV